MKPIFEEERDFLKEYGIEIPEYCWRDGSKIYINCTDEIPIIEFKADLLNDRIHIKKNFIKEINGGTIHICGKYKNKKFDLNIVNKSFITEAKLNEQHLNDLCSQSIKMTTEYLNSHLDYEYNMSISGGKDSSVMNYIFENFIKDNLIKKDIKKMAFNTTNDTADTYRQIYYEGLTKEDIINPLIGINIVDDNGNKHREYKNMGWYQWIEQVKEYWIPNALKRSCCSTFKEGQVKRVQDKNKKYVTLLGVRKYESVKRAFYEFDIRQAYNNKNKKYNMPNHWERIAPICYWTDKDVWLYIILNNLKVNPMYYKGFNRCGCLICPYNSEYTDLLIKKYYPQQYNRWMKIIEKNYEVKNVKNRLKWSLDEYKGGKWRVGVSKEYELINSKKTKERIKELSEIKGISETMAEKYWDKKCECGKKLNPDEIAMFYKMFGRYENEEDNRKLLCKKCLCEKLEMTTKEYSEKIKEFRQQGCNLF